MPEEPPPLDYRPARRALPARPARLLSYTFTTAALCPVAIFFDSMLRYDGYEARRVALLELVLATCGTAFAVACIARRGLRADDKVAVAGCLLLFGITAFVAVLMPRVIHN